MSLSTRPVILLALAVIISGCASTIRPPATEATVGVRATGCSLIANFGTGVAIRADLIATSAHTVAGASAVVVVDRSGSEHPAQVVGFDPSKDVAILRVDVSLPFSPLGQVDKGSDGLLATWHPDRGFEEANVVVTRLLNVTIEDIYVDEISERRAFEIAADVVAGDSGGPVFNDDGDVAGIIYARARDRADVGFVLDAIEIDALLDRTTAATVANGRCL